uniref:Plant heme peroxidase family profile domain-containing protein n=1 Tax=Ditylum brightwellii TaxID=49249 RepID=A0A7S4SNS9_9STRA
MLLTASNVAAFQTAPTRSSHSSTALFMKDEGNDRRSFLSRSSAMLVGGLATGLALESSPQPANAVVYFDPAMYGDQELRSAAIDSLRESVRRGILQKPTLAPAFYQMALLDGLSFDFDSKKGGPDGRIIRQILTSDAKGQYIDNLKEAANVLIAASKALKKYTAITIADAVAISGAEALNSIGGPIISIQLGRTDAPLKDPVSDLPLELLSGERSNAEVIAAFRRSGMTDREMTALLGGLLTLETVQKNRPSEDWRKSARGKFREPGKIGRASEFKRLTDEDIADMEAMEEDGYEEDDGWYIADTFGTRDQSFGARVAGSDISKEFNKYLKEVNKASSSKTATGSQFGWIGEVLLDPKNPTTLTWLSKYSQSDLNYKKDLTIAYGAITQLGAEYTGGKYENLLKGKPRKSLNDN